MKRKNFLKRGVLGLGTMLAMPTVLTACGNNGADPNDSTGVGKNSCGEWVKYA